MDLGFFQETKVIKGIYIQESSGYRVVASEAPISHNGGVAMFYQATEKLSVEALRLYGENVARFKLALGGRRWFIVGCYLAPDNALTIEDIFASISQWTRGAALMVVGYFNTNMAAPEVWAWDEVIVSALSEEGL